MAQRDRRSEPKKEKTAKQMERHLKGVANHHRIAILLYVAKHRGATLEEIVEASGSNDRTIGEHSRRLVEAGLVNKQYKGRHVLHELSPYGKQFVSFLAAFQSNN